MLAASSSTVDSRCTLRSSCWRTRSRSTASSAARVTAACRCRSTERADDRKSQASAHATTPTAMYVTESGTAFHNGYDEPGRAAAATFANASPTVPSSVQTIGHSASPSATSATTLKL